MLITVNEKIKNNKSNLSHSKIISPNNLFVQRIERDFDGNPSNICVCIVYISSIGSCKMSDRCGIISFAETLTGFQASEHRIILIFVGLAGADVSENEDHLSVFSLMYVCCINLTLHLRKLNRP